MARVALTIRLSDETLAMLDILAKRKDVNRTVIVTELIREEVERRGINVPGVFRSSVSDAEDGE